MSQPWTAGEVLRVISKFTPAPVDVECVDVWHPETLSEAAMLAYKALEVDGILRITKVHISRYTGRTDVRYLTQIPHEWILERLREEKLRFEAMGKQLEMEGV